MPVANVLSEETTTLPSGKLVAMQRLPSSPCLAPVVACKHESCRHQGMHPHLLYSNLLASLHPALLKRSGGQQGAVPRPSKQTTHQSFIPLCVKLISQGKPVIQDCLVPILLAASCSVYIFPRSPRKPAGLPGCSTSLFHTWNDALQQDDGTKISL